MDLNWTGSYQLNPFHTLPAMYENQLRENLSIELCGANSNCRQSGDSFLICDWPVL